MDSKENVIEWLTGDEYCYVTATDRRKVSKIKKAYAETPDEFREYHENSDGSIYCCYPLKWELNIKNKKRQLTEEQKASLLMNLRKDNTK